MSAAPRVRTALALSTLAHAAVLGALLLTVRPAPPPRPLAVHLVPLSTEAAAAGPSGAGAAADGPAGAPPRARPRPQELRLGPEGALAPLSAGPPAGQLAVEAAAVPVQGQQPAPAEGTASGGATSGPGPAGVGGGGPGPSSLLGELHRRLAEAARRCYPPAAQRFRLQGEVPVHFCLDAQGQATALRLEGSTGSALLDRSALECVVPGAAPLPGLEGCFLVPVHFGG